MLKTAMTTLLAACTAMLASCSTPYSIPKYDARPSGQTRFDGIAQLLTAQKGAPLDVVMVHGMCTHDGDWAEATIRRLNKSLGGEQDVKVHPAPVQGTQITLFRSRLAVTGGTVRATAMLWSPVTRNLKNQLCYDQTNKSVYCPVTNPPTPRYEHERATLNRDLKDDILNDCLADAMIYQGKSGPEIQKQVQDALLSAVGSFDSPALPRSLALGDALKAAATAPNNMVIITESLGSKIAFDAIRELRKMGDLQKRAADRTLERTVQIFMTANQLPILSLADQYLNSDAPPDPLDALLQTRKSDRPLNVVAFTDPNDLLSYALVKQPKVNYRVTDVIVSNDTTYFGYAEHPANAHRHYRENSEVIRRIACGSSGVCPR